MWLRPASAALLAVLLGSAMLVAAASAADGRSWRGQELRTYLESLRHAGLQVVYSSDLVSEGMPLPDEPHGATAAERLDDALRMFGLASRQGPDRIRIVIRSAPRTAGSRRREATSTAPPALDELIVTASRYDIGPQSLTPAMTLGSLELQSLPDLGDDPLRAIARLPGTSTGGLTARSNFRGGRTDETLVLYDGVRLYNPFHLRDFQAIFGALDPGIVDEINVYTGGFSSRFGDRMSGVIDISPRPPADGLTRKISLSVLNAGALAAGTWPDADADWLVSGRRGNLDLVLDLVAPEYGSPRYSEWHGRVGRRFSDAVRISGNALVSRDQLQLSDGDIEERAEASYRDVYLWVRGDFQLAASLYGWALASHSALASRRTGTAIQAGVGAGSVADEREFRIATLASGWTWRPRSTLQLSAGGDLRVADGVYRYRDDAEFEVLFDTPGAATEVTRTRDLQVAADGHMAAFHLGALSQWTQEISTEFGARWDYSDLGTGDSTFSPRIGTAWQPTDRTRLRVYYGWFRQLQGIEELAVNDGVTTYTGAETARQLGAGLDQQLGQELTARFELYDKRYSHLRTRFENLLLPIVLLPEIKPDRVSIPAHRAVARGIELSMGNSPARDLHWWLGYGWSSTRERIGDERLRRSWDQTHSVGGGMLWRRGPWEWSGAITWHAGWPTTAASLAARDPVPTIGTGPRNGERLNRFQSVDLRVARRFQPARGTVTAYLELTNATHRRNQCCVDYGFETDRDPPALELDNQVYLPILPSAGFTWDF